MTISYTQLQSDIAQMKSENTNLLEMVKNLKTEKQNLAKESVRYLEIQNPANMSMNFRPAKNSISNCDR